MFSTHRLAIWPTLPLNVHFRKPSQWQPFPLDQEGCRIFSRARHAIWNACRALGLGANDVILVPAYHHGSEIEALLQADLKIRYYELNETLEPEVTQLESLLSPEVRALYIIHYLGFPQNAAYWRQWCDERGVLLIEDAAQAFLSNQDSHPIGSFGHLSVFCLYKTFGIPDGGALISIAPPPIPKAAAQSGIWRLFKRHFNWLAERHGLISFIHLHLSPIFKHLGKIRSKPHEEFGLQDPLTPPSAMTTRLLSRIVDNGTAARRRENYLYLLKHLGELVPGPFASLPEGACPFAFPLEVNDARDFLKKLHRLGVMGLLFWVNPHPSLPVPDFPKSRNLREKILALPVHQELTSPQLQQIVKAVRKALVT